MIVIFPFEEPLYREAGVPVDVRRPPARRAARGPATDRAAFLAAQGLDAARPVLAVLPGSRRQEVAHNLPADRGRAAPAPPAASRDLQLALAVAPSLDPAPLRPRRSRGCPSRASRATRTRSSARRRPASSPRAPPRSRRRSSTCRWSSSTASRPLTYALGRPFVQVPHYAMANLIAGREVVKELIQGDFRPEAVAAEVLALLDDPGRRAAVRQGLAEIRAAARCRRGPRAARRRSWPASWE